MDTDSSYRFGKTAIVLDWGHVMGWVEPYQTYRFWVSLSAGATAAK